MTDSCAKQVHSEPIPELGGATWAELEVVRHGSGRLLFPDKLRRRNERGEVIEIPVRVWVPNAGDHVEARLAARVWFASKKGLDPDRDKDLFDEMEQICLLARAIRTAAEPHPQFATHDELCDYDEHSLHDIQERVNVYKELVDPRVQVVDDATFWSTVAAVARRSTLLPLTGIAGRAQSSFLLRLAREALRSPTAPSSARSSESSTPAPSAPPS